MQKRPVKESRQTARVWKEKPVKLRIFGNSDHNTAFFLVIGQLVVHWANNENMFLRILVSLMDNKLETARVVFYSHKNTVGRLDLVSTLIKSKIADKSIIEEFDRLSQNFRNLGRKRNFFAHCMYDSEGNPPSLVAATGIIFDNQSHASRSETVRMDAHALREIDNTNIKFLELNQNLWAFVDRLDAYLASKPQELHGSHDA